jgi:pimeloyl-ACP methyl ester carboxylesterase
VFGAKPMLVLTHGRYDPEDPIDTIGQAGVVALAQDTARLSRRGRQRTVPDTGHNIQIEAPDAIVKAVEEVLDALDPPKPAR